MVIREEGIWTVYRHTSPSGRVYIGITSKEDVRQRWKYGEGYRLCRMFNKAIKKYGWKNIKHEVLFRGLSEDRAKNLEIALIRHYKNLGISYNITNGGQGILGMKFSEESKEKMRKAKLGRTLPEETKRKMSLSRIGRECPTKGIPWSEERREHMSKIKKGKKTIYHISKEELIRRFKEAQKGVTSVPVLQYSLDGKLIAQFCSQREAALAVGTRASCISNCCLENAKGKHRTIKGYIWRKAV